MSSTLQERKKEKNAPTTKSTLHKHAVNMLVSTSNLFSSANKEKTKQQREKAIKDNTEPKTIAEKKKADEKKKQTNIMLFVEKSLLVIVKTLIYVGLSIEFIMFCEFYNNNMMVGIDPDSYPYVDPEKIAKEMKGGNAVNDDASTKTSRSERAKQSIKKTLLGDRNTWQSPWKNRATQQYPNTSNWGLGKWLMYYSTEVSMNVVALSRNILYHVFATGALIWRPKSYFMNAIFIILAGWLVRTGGIFGITVIVPILTIAFALMKAGTFWNGWDLFQKPSKYVQEENVFKNVLSGFVKFILLLMMVFVLVTLLFGYLGFAYIFMFLLTPFMGTILRGGNENAPYDFSGRFLELMWKNKALITIMILLYITDDAYKYLGNHVGYVFSGLMIGLIINFIYNILRATSVKEVVAGVKSRAKTVSNTASSVFKKKKTKTKSNAKN